MRVVYTDEQIEALRKYYPNSEYDELFRFFPGFTKSKIGTIAYNHGITNNNPGHRKDLKGKVFGNLTVTEVSHVDKHHIIWWKCICSCGKETVVRAASLLKGVTQSCGCLRREYFSKDHTGKRFGLLKAVERIPHYNNTGRTYYRCVCDCGNECIVQGGSLVSGKRKSCGCIRKTKSPELIPDI